jgi:hypothetical protein
VQSVVEQAVSARALRGPLVLCEEVTVILRFAARPVLIRIPGRTSAYRAARPRAQTTARFAGALHRELEEDLRFLASLAAEGPSRHVDPLRRIERIDIVMCDGRSYPRCGIDLPLDAPGQLRELNFQLRHRGL